MGSGSMRMTAKRTVVLVMMLFLIPCLLTSCQLRADEKLQGKSVLVVLPDRDFYDKEFTRCQRQLRSAGADIVLASARGKEARGQYGLRATPDVTLRWVQAEDYDGVLFLGGPGARQYWEDRWAHRILREAQKEELIIGALSHATVALDRAGVVEGRRVTVYPALGVDIEAATTLGTGVVVDGRVVTGREPEVAEEFIRAYINRLARVK